MGKLDKKPVHIAEYANQFLRTAKNKERHIKAQLRFAAKQQAKKKAG